jgi:hypothetical protein
METPKSPPSLDDLLIRATARMQPKKERRKPTDTIDPKELAQAERRLRERFSNPENWERVRSVALVHDTTDTLLGNFTEYRHKLSSGVCRKFVRVSGPEPVDAIERIKGDNWHAEELHKPGKPDVPEREVREAMIDIHLPELDNVFAPQVIVDVHLHWGHIARVELVDETAFFSKDRRVHLYLPEGIDVLDGMSLDCRLNLRKWLGL